MKEELVQMRDKLNNISKSNRSIRLLKLYDKWSYDLTQISNEMVKTIVEAMKKKSTKSYPLVTNEIDEVKNASINRKLTTLYRNMKGIEDETGVYDFYLGTPFVTGTFSDGTFFQSPLFLYPIRLEKGGSNRQQWVLQKNEEDPILNRTLFLAFKKINQIHVSEEWMERATEVALLNESDIINYLAEANIKVKPSKSGYKVLKEYKKEDIPVLSPLALVQNAVIGHFPQGSSSLVRDYHQLIELSEESNLSLVGEMLNPQDKEICESDWDHQETEQEKIREFDRLYLLETDGSQEDILKEARFKKGMAVHGPPGTGKSQLIVNLITDALSQRKRVLVVCQKRAALDVVYQRLQNLDLAKFTALVHDENHDRKALYAKIHETLSWSADISSDVEEKLMATSKKLEEEELVLNNIAQGLHVKHDFGMNLYELYSKAKSTLDSFVYIDVEALVDNLQVEGLHEILSQIYIYGEWYARFGRENYPLKERLSFAKFGMKDKIDFISKINDTVQKMKKAEEYILLLDDKEITPAYTWLNQEKLIKIQLDLDDEKPRTLQGLRLWFWTSFTGKLIVRGLNKGVKFSGVKSREWIKIKKGLLAMNYLAEVTSEINYELDVLKCFFQPSRVEKLKKMMAEGVLPLKELDQILEHITADFDGLHDMDQFREECSSAAKKAIDLLIEKSNQFGSVGLPQKWVSAIRESVYLYWIEAAEKKFPVVKKVSTSEYNRMRLSFKESVENKKEMARLYLVNDLRNHLSKTQERLKASFKDLKFQAGKKRKVWPLRRLVKEYVESGLMDVSPVWLASPEIVSSIFPLTVELFDLVIFDEASQCTVENGLPSIYRAKQVIVAGDEMQLPPSNLFQSMVAGDEDEEDFSSNDSPSLLNLAKRRFDEKTLQWHYRSKSEELINFSNHAFYNGAIQISPNVQPYKKTPAMQWVKVDNGRWVDRHNEVEAKEVIRILNDLLRMKQDKSIGIITFNSDQQTKIMDMIEAETINNLEFGAMYGEAMSKDLDERVFVKNIENVQGDERDIILFSVGYGKNKGGRVYNRFGSLNLEGGENRLNVAVTRAKEETIVISSIEPEELNVANSKSNGPRLLKSYLNYVRAVSNGQIERVQEVILEVNELGNTKVSNQPLDFDSPFEVEVYEKLKALGYKVQTQVGMSGYRIDLAVVHPTDSSRFILGIECDGAMYHSSKNAKERDVYRQKFLESRGWNIERIWSRNWWKNPTVEIERIDKAIKKIAKQDELSCRVPVQHATQ